MCRCTPTESMPQTRRASLRSAHGWIVALVVATIAPFTAAAVTVELVVDAIDADTATVSAVLHSSGDPVGGVQNDILFDTDIVALDSAARCTIAAAIGTAHAGCDDSALDPSLPCKTLTRAVVDCGATPGAPGCQGQPGNVARFRALIVATAVPNLHSIPSGAVLYTCAFTILEPAELPTELVVANVVASDPVGVRLAAIGISTSITSPGGTPQPTRTRTITPTPSATRSPTPPRPTATPTTVPTRTATKTWVPTAIGTPQPLGFPCHFESQCTSGFCVDHTCCDVAGCPDGEHCRVTHSPGRCSAPLGVGSGCNLDSDCISANCWIGHPDAPLGMAGTCGAPRTPTPVAPGGRCDAAGAGCPGGRFCNVAEGGICCDQPVCPLGWTCRHLENVGVCTERVPFVDEEAPGAGDADAPESRTGADSDGCTVRGAHGSSLPLILLGLLGLLLRCGNRIIKERIRKAAPNL